MNILITAASENELLIAKQVCNNIPHQVTCVATGIGIAATTYHTVKQFQHGDYDLAINIGIAGSFCERFPIGSVVVVNKEYFGDIGIQTQSGFDTLFDQQLMEDNTFPFVNGALHCAPLSPEVTAALEIFPRAVGVTVHTTSGQVVRIEELRSRFTPDIETMEGAAFFYVCLHEKVPFVEMRSVSNKVAPRDKNTWDIPEVLGNLKTELKSFLQNIA